MCALESIKQLGFCTITSEVAAWACYAALACYAAWACYGAFDVMNV